MGPCGVWRFTSVFLLLVYGSLGRICTAVGALLDIAVEGCRDLLTLMA